MTLWFLDASERAQGLAREFPEALDWFATSNARLTAGSVVLVHKTHFADQYGDEAVKTEAASIFAGCDVSRDGAWLNTQQLAAALLDLRAQLRGLGASVRLVWFSGDGIASTRQAGITMKLRTLLGDDLPDVLYVERRVQRVLDAASAGVLQTYISARGQTHGNAMAGARALTADQAAAKTLREQVAAWLLLTSGSDLEVAPEFLAVTQRLRTSQHTSHASIVDEQTLDRLRTEWLSRGLIITKQPHG